MRHNRYIVNGKLNIKILLSRQGALMYITKYIYLVQAPDQDFSVHLVGQLLFSGTYFSRHFAKART